MPVRLAACHAAVIAAFIVLFPGHIGAGEFDGVVFPKIRLAALVEASVREIPGIKSAPDNSLLGKWRRVRARMSQEQRLVSLCRADPAACPSDAATQFMAMVDAARSREGRALIGTVNRDINLAIRPASDRQRHDSPDVWTSPLATLAAGQGDCEDYAIAKLAALWAAGVPEHDTRLVIVHDPRAREDHALAMVRLEGRWLALDNRRFTLIDAAHLTYRPLFVLTGDRVRAFDDRTSWSDLDAADDIVLSADPEYGPSGAGGAPVLM